jgi:hypothetical protein
MFSRSGRKGYFARSGPDSPFRDVEIVHVVRPAPDIPKERSFSRFSVVRRMKGAVRPISIETSRKRVETGWKTRSGRPPPGEAYRAYVAPGRRAPRTRTTPRIGAPAP